MAASLTLGLALPGRAADDDAAHYVQFVQEPAGDCVARDGMQILVKNTHPTRKLRVWLDRWQAGHGTGDRSRTDLPAGSEPEALGCSRNSAGPQEWRLVRAQFVE
ncbi:MAG: hypothetical protein JSR59_03540 [Proteobacteria bacterium]|nr:hypothetical protein [Pseudomonadota bacterium]